MRVAMMMSFLIMAQIGWAVGASGQTPPTATNQHLILIPTAFQQLPELRVNTGQKAILSDGTMNAVYVKKLPSAENTYLNFHVELDAEAGPIVLHTGDIRLQGAGHGTSHPRVAGTEWNVVPESEANVSYVPMDWFLDTGAAEERGSALTVQDKTIVQFTIEVPRVGFDDLTLFVQTQRIGTVREIRARIARVGEIG